ncbi:MAG: L7Ae/L30e/S12e/Gadd45 family ribosomal protein [Acholeplasmataceae bacterium]|jgi:ribosomal protein L7Ae-like RNA K-turn-binding protein
MIQTIGLAHRAKKATIGTEMTIDALRKQQLHLIVLATDASMLTKKKVYDKAKTYQTEVLEVITSDVLSHALGKKDIKVIGITDLGFSQLLMNEKRK